MTLRENLSNVENLAGLTGLGQLADRAALGAHRAQTNEMSADDREALAHARELLVQVRDFSGATLPPQASLRAMGPIAVLKETFGAVSRTDEDMDVTALVSGLIGAIDEIVSGSASTTQMAEVETFFDGLSRSTLESTTALAHRGPERRLRWMSGALT